MGLDGRVVAITGAARGLGRSYASLFAAEGASVVVADVDGEGAAKAAQEIETEGGRALAVAVDLTDDASTKARAPEAEARFGAVGVLVNNAGIWGDLQREPLATMDAGYWDVVMAVNLKGPFLCARAVLPGMIAAGWGRIVNISSMGAYMSAGVYGVSKLALNQLTFALATEVGDCGVTVNAVAPGTIANDATLRQVPPAGMEKMVNAAVVKRPGTAEDLFGMIRYLTSDDAAWVTGQTFMVNGGFSTRF